MGRSPCCDESGLKKGPWTPEEDDKLIKHIQKHGHGSWRALPKLAGLNRCGKSCRLRWTNYLRPDIKRGKFSQEEEQTILNLHAILGNKWSTIASQLPGRTDNEIKNFWNTHLKKKLIQMGFDPMTHRPRTDLFSTLPQLIALANLFDNPSWPEDHPLRLNHCLDALLQTLSPSSPTFPNNTASADMETFGLLNSLNDASSSILSLLEARPPSQASSGFLQESMPGFPHLPHLQAAPCGVTIQNCSLSKGGSAAMVEGSDFGAVLSRGEISPGSSSPWMMPLNTSPSSTPSAVAPVAGTPAGNDVVDACTPSGYGGAQMWSELLNDPIFHDLA